MKKILLSIAVIVAGLIGVAAFRGEAFALSFVAGQTEKRSLDALQALIVPALTIRKPETAPETPNGLYPVVFQLHGCGGFGADHQNQYADIAVEEGYMAVMISSNAPRGFDHQASLDKICTGQALLGQERAGDILAAMEHVFENEKGDPNHVVLSGWSHGAWTVMDFLSMDLERTIPASLSAYDGPARPVRASVLFYPYCSFGSRTRVHGWAQSPDVMALMGEADTVVDHRDCLKNIAALEEAGVAIDKTLYPDTEHAFDSPSLRGPIAHWYHPAHARDARARYRSFLKRHNPVDAF